jgi:hypothetical protein
MNKKQICHITFTPGPYSWGLKPFDGYGICLGNDRYLLENGMMFTDKGDGTGAAASKFYEFSHNADCYLKTDRSAKLNDVSVTATRNVPQEVRDAMENAYVSARKMDQMAEKFFETRDAFNKLMKEEEAAINAMPAAVRQVRGTLSKDEFVDAFISALPPYVKAAMDNSRQKGYDGNYSRPYEVSFGSNIEIYRSVWIEKWARPSFTYVEYDDTRCMCSDAEKNPEYQGYMRKYSKPLPVSKKADFEEYLTLGDKNSLEYHGSYTVHVDDRKPLTRAYAKKLADEFVGKTKGMDREEEMER